MIWATTVIKIPISVGSWLLAFSATTGKRADAGTTISSSNSSSSLSFSSDQEPWELSSLFASGGGVMVQVLAGGDLPVPVKRFFTCDCVWFASFFSQSRFSYLSIHS
jgi:hypothetical protein